MIQVSTLDFLRELAQNNDRDWFDAHRKDYQKAKKNVESATNDLIEGVARFDPGIAGLEGKKCLFRIFRDTRFSPNKQPYKTNMGAWMAPGGRKSVYGGYYFHVQPGASFIAGGVYHPGGETLKLIREAIDYDAAPLRKILDNPEFKQHFGELQGDKLKSAPRGYAKDHPEIELLRHKDLVVTRNISDQELTSGDWLAQAIESFRVLQPLNAFLNQAIAEGMEM